MDEKQRRRRCQPAARGVVAGESSGCLPTTTACSLLLLSLLLLVFSLSFAGGATAAAAATDAPLVAGGAVVSKGEEALLLSKKKAGGRGRGSAGAREEKKRSSGGRMSVADALSLPTPPPLSSSEHEQQQDGQCFPYSRTHSVAAASFRFPVVDELSGAPTGQSQQAERGRLARLRCDSVVCPPPAVQDCYMREGVCDAEREYCLLEDHVKFGPAAAGLEGRTPLVAYLDCSYFASEKEEYPWIWEQVCSNRSDWGPWTTTRGRCVPYRTEQQSCSGSIWRPKPESTSKSQSPPQLLSPQYAASARDGRPPLRPLLCAPGLHCTEDAPPTPNTCVKARPSNVCFQGPWWDSTSPGACPRAELVQRWNERNTRRKKKDFSASSPPTPAPPPPGGLPLPELLSAAAAFLANAPVELYESPLNPRYWSDAPLRSARETAAAALEALWPERYRESTQFPLRLPEPAGAVFSRDWNATAALAHAAYRQIGRAWAAVHSLVHNAPEPLSPRQAEASAALALWLRQHVSCCNCRGFFSQLLNEVGLPPIGSTSRTEHARWWWRTHNAVSEHAASTRGGHPFLYPSMPDDDFRLTFGREYGNEDALRCQNPWFLGWEDAVEMWTLPPVDSAAFEEEEEGGEGGGEGEEREEE